jgi:hypothetical protein
MHGLLEASGGFEVPRDDPGEERGVAGYQGFERRSCKAGGDDRFVIAEMKGADWGGLTDVTSQAAHRWCAAVTPQASSVSGTTDWHSACVSLPRSWTCWRGNAWQFHLDRGRIQV